jgi:hypothetical protein
MAPLPEIILTAWFVIVLYNVNSTSMEDEVVVGVGTIFGTAFGTGNVLVVFLAQEPIVLALVLEPVVVVVLVLEPELDSRV